MKKQFVTFVLICSIVLCFHTLAAPRPPEPQQPQFTLVEICIVGAIIGLMVGALICVTIYNHVGNPTNSPPPPNWPTNPPLPPGPYTNTNEPFPAVVRLPVITNSGPVPMFDISSLNITDALGGAMFTNGLQVTLRAGDDPATLAPLYTIRAYLSAKGRLCEWSDSNGLPVWTNYSPWGAQARVPLELGTGLERQRFFSLQP